ncbi:MAG: peptide chain release factor N(5)-glutamine methyltransferase [Endomicrobiia bacterium]
MKEYSLKELYNFLFQQFSKKKFSSPGIETEVIISKTLKIDRSFIYCFPEKKLSADLIKKIFRNFALRINYVPAEYIFKEKEFFGLKFYVDSRVLIPRPETEFLVEEAISLIKTKNIKTFADVCTGSGNIVISILKNVDLSKVENVYATDFYKSALDVAIKNSEVYNLKGKIKFILTDKLEYFLKNKIKLDLITCNPPYVTYKEYTKLQPEIYYEPKHALVVERGMEFYEYFSNQAKKIVKKGGYLLLEINPALCSEISKAFNNDFYKIEKIILDYQKLPRCLMVKVLKNESC